MGFPIDPIGATRHLRSARDADLVAATRPVAGVASAAGRKGPRMAPTGWGEASLVKSTGSDHRKPL